jgi:hypothetical protein
MTMKRTFIDSSAHTQHGDIVSTPTRVSYTDAAAWPHADTEQHSAENVTTFAIRTVALSAVGQTAVDGNCHFNTRVNYEWRTSTCWSKNIPQIISTYTPCILILSKFFIHQLMHEWIVLKTILKFTLKLTLKQLRHVSVQSHHHQGAHYSCLLKLQLLKQPIKIHPCVVMFLRPFTCASVGE